MKTIDEKVSFKSGDWGQGSQVKLELAGYLDEVGVYAPPPTTDSV